MPNSIEERNEFLRYIINKTVVEGDNNLLQQEMYDFFIKCTGGKVYKYRYFDKKRYAIDSLKTGTIHCSPPSAFNDPYDCKIGLDIQSLLIAKKWNIPITTLEEHDIDLSVDGADEVDLQFNLIKGGGAAHTKEKIVDYAAKEFIVIVDESKCVDTLGSFPVPVEVLPDASRVVIQALEDMGAECEIRMAQRKDGPVITDNGNFVIDAKFEEIESPACLEIDLNSIPGVVENGIFSDMVDKVIVGTEDGTKEL